MSETTRRILAWGVHAYTALGVVLGFWMILAAVEGRVTTVLWLFFAAMFVDGTDGLLARALQVKRYAPGMDGSLLDNIIDYITYTLAPMVLLWSLDLVPAGAWGQVVLAIPLLASTYQFCRSDAKTEDHFFTGFPSYWNIVAFYVVTLGLGVTATTVILMICAVLVFVPIRYVYPSRTAALWHTNMVMAALWLVAYAVICLQMPDPSRWLVWSSLAYAVFYAAESVWLTFRRP